MIAKLITECIGTFFLVLTIVLVAPQPYAAFAIAAVLTAMIYAGGHVSGAHYNPAITVAFWICKEISFKEVAPYVVAQFVGAIAACGVGAALGGAPNEVLPPIGSLHSMVAEITFTFALAFTILSVAVHPKTSGNSYFGVAIGAVVFCAVVAVGDISGAALNPAVGVPLYALRDQPLTMTLVYVVSPMVGAALAALAFRTILKFQS